MISLHVLKTFDNVCFISSYTLDTMLTFISSSPMALRKMVCVKRIRLIIVTLFKGNIFMDPA